MQQEPTGKRKYLNLKVQFKKKIPLGWDKNEEQE